MKDDIDVSPESGKRSFRLEAQRRYDRGLPPDGAGLPEGAEPLIRELAVRKIELELEVEELRRTHDELAASQERYFDLYDLAPVGYATLAAGGTILEANLTLARWLGVEQRALPGAPLSRWIAREHAAAYRDHLGQLLRTGQPASIEVAMARQDGTTLWANVDAVPHHDEPSGSWTCRIALTDVTNRKRAERERQELLEGLDRLVAERTAELRDAIAYNRSLIETSLDPLVTIDAEGKVSDVNEATVAATGLPREELIGSDFADYFTDPARAREGYAAAFRDGSVRDYELLLKGRDGRTTAVEYNAALYRHDDGSVAGLFAAARDVSARKESELYREIGRSVLRIFNERRDLRESIQTVVDVVKGLTGFDAVGIRLRQDDDFPYLVQEGFSEEFVVSENSLLERKGDGSVCRDAAGNVRLECTCGLVLTGRTDPSNPLFTPAGSCWTNDAQSFPAEPSPDDPRYRPRNTCIHQGYASVALVPIRSGSRILGLVQLNDRRKGRLSLGAVELLEEAASFLGVALTRRFAEQALEKLHEELERRVDERTAELARSRALLDETARLSRVGGWEYDAGTGTLSWTEVTYAIHELPPGGPVSVEGWKARFAPDSRPRFAARLQAAVEAGEPFDEELEVDTAQGRRIWVRAVGKPETGRGRVVRLAGVLQDIHARKMRMLALEEAQHELESFSYSTSHELRAPLRAIDGHGALLERELGDGAGAEARRRLELIRWNAQRMGRLIDDLLEYFRIGHDRVDCGEVDMAAAARKAFEHVVEGRSGSTRISFTAAPLPAAQGDPALLLTVWERLLSNAVKFSSVRSDPAIAVTGAERDGEVVYTVADNGVGFDMSYVEKLFGIFHRLHGQDEFEGTGVGLALARRIVVRHGGRIWAESEPGRGAAFHFALPATPPAESSLSRRWRRPSGPARSD